MDCRVVQTKCLGQAPLAITRFLSSLANGNVTGGHNFLLPSATEYGGWVNSPALRYFENSIIHRNIGSHESLPLRLAKQYSSKLR
ncbi:hypothetical protein CHELA1G2_13133 [Hyphomicrobiales bacterium]|nr:hypothetical protein CHELA1G2_13133 [Hyphomicrobiales bacterium]